MSLELKIKILKNGEGLPVPFYATEKSAGLDLFAAVSEDIVLCPNKYNVIPLGFSIALPDDLEAQIRSRSGLASKFGVCVLNAPGTIDPDYRGEVGAIMINLGTEDFVIKRGMRIAQMVIAKFSRIKFDIVQELDNTERGAGSYGSTGL